MGESWGLWRAGRRPTPPSLSPGRLRFLPGSQPLPGGQQHPPGTRGQAVAAQVWGRNRSPQELTRAPAWGCAHKGCRALSAPGGRKLPEGFSPHWSCPGAAPHPARPGLSPSVRAVMSWGGEPSAGLVAPVVWEMALEVPVDLMPCRAHLCQDVPGCAGLCRVCSRQVPSPQAVHSLMMPLWGIERLEIRARRCREQGDNAISVLSAWPISKLFRVLIRQRGLRDAGRGLPHRAGAAWGCSQVPKEETPGAGPRAPILRAREHLAGPMPIHGVAE